MTNAYVYIMWACMVILAICAVALLLLVIHIIRGE